MTRLCLSANRFVAVSAVWAHSKPAYWVFRDQLLQCEELSVGTGRETVRVDLLQAQDIRIEAF